MLNPFPHQNKAVDAIFDYYENEDGVPLVISPVGSGKSLIIAEFIRRLWGAYPEMNVLVIAHVTELLTQNADHLRMQCPTADISFYAQKLGRKSFAGRAIFASINGVYKKAYKIPKRIDVIILDEAHMLSFNDQTMYRKFISDLLVINKEMKILGLTGTGFRPTEGRLTEGEGRLFTDVAYQIPMLYLIEKGFLCPLVTPSVNTKMSTVGVATKNGDYIESQLQKAVDKDYITRACVDEIMHYGQDRKRWLIFTAGVEHCKNVCDEIKSRGVACEMILGSTPDKERAAVYARFKSGETKCLVNVGVATTGVNIPAIDLMAFMRPTRSRVLYVQMGGRGMRTYPGKTDCCLLDFGGVIGELGPIDLVDARKVHEGSGNGEAPIKVCPTCHAVCFAGVRECQDCGYQFPDSGLDLKKTASTMAVMSNQIEPEWHNVIGVSYRLHAKDGKVPSMCVTYNTLDGPFREYICYEHIGYAREKACKWHKRRTDEPVPTKILDALRVNFSKPVRIQTRQTGKYFEIISYDFTS